jgi:hypothetical protein
MRSLHDCSTAPALDRGISNGRLGRFSMLLQANDPRGEVPAGAVGNIIPDGNLL